MTDLKQIFGLLVGRYKIEKHRRKRSCGINEERVGLWELKRRSSLQIRTTGLKGKGKIQNIIVAKWYRIGQNSRK